MFAPTKIIHRKKLHTNRITSPPIRRELPDAGAQRHSNATTKLLVTMGTRFSITKDKSEIQNV